MQLSLPEANMCPDLMVIPMREELARAGIKEARTAEEVDAALNAQSAASAFVSFCTLLCLSEYRK